MIDSLTIVCNGLIWKWSILSMGLWSFICILMGLVMTVQHKEWGYITASYRGVLTIGLLMGLVLGGIAGPSIGLVERDACQHGTLGPAESLWKLVDSRQHNK